MAVTVVPKAKVVPYSKAVATDSLFAVTVPLIVAVDPVTKVAAVVVTVGTKE